MLEPRWCPVTPALGVSTLLHPQESKGPLAGASLAGGKASWRWAGLTPSPACAGHSSPEGLTVAEPERQVVLSNSGSPGGVPGRPGNKAA